METFMKDGENVPAPPPPNSSQTLKKKSYKF